MARGFVRASSERLYYESTPPVIQEPFTVALWFNIVENFEDTIWGFGASTSFNHFFNIGVHDSSNGYYLYQRTNDGAGQVQATTSNARAGNTWEHACAIHAADNDRTIVLNGDWANRGTNTTSKTVTTSLNRWAIGAYPNGGGYYQYFGGYVAEFAIWNVALEQYEVAALSKRIRPLYIRPSGLVSYVPMWRDEDRDYIYNIGFSASGTPDIADHAPMIWQIPKTLAVKPVSECVTTITDIETITVTVVVQE